MLVALNQVVGTMKGILIFSNEYNCLLFSRNRERIKEEQRVRSRKLVMPFVQVFATTHRHHGLFTTTSHREKLRKEKHREDIPESHSCICAHCGRRFPQAVEEEISDDSDTSDDTQIAESEENS